MGAIIANRRPRSGDVRGLEGDRKIKRRRSRGHHARPGRKVFEHESVLCVTFNNIVIYI